MKLHYYSCIFPEKMPAYDEYDYAKGLIGYKHKLSDEVLKETGVKYVGHGTSGDIYKPLKSMPGRVVKTVYQGFGDRY